MTLRVNPENGSLLKLDNGSLMKKCCCEAPEESGWFKCVPYWCTGPFTAPERFPAMPVLDSGINFMMYFSETAREKWDEELGSPSFYYDGRMLWELKEFLTGDPDPTEDYYSANGWLSVPRQFGNPFGTIVMSELENGYPEAQGSEYGFLSDPVPKEFTVVDAGNRRVFHGLNFSRSPGGLPPNPPQGFEIQAWNQAYQSPFFPPVAEIFLGLPPNHNAWHDIEIIYDPDNPYVISSVSTSSSGSFPTAGFVPASYGQYHQAQTTINWLGGNYTVNGVAFFKSFGGKNNGGLAYPNPSEGNCNYYNMVSGLFHWAFPLTFPGAAGHSQFGGFDIQQTCFGGVDPRPCYALTVNNDNVPDCVQYGPPCHDIGQAPGSPAPDGIGTDLPQCGFIVPTASASSSGTAFSQPLNVCQAAFGEDCPGGAASDWFAAANTYNDYFLPPDGGAFIRITGVSKSFDDTGMAPFNFNIPPSGTLPGGILNQQCALEIRFP